MDARRNVLTEVLGLVLGLGPCLGAAIPAQSAASSGHFLVGVEPASGARVGSSSLLLDALVGGAVVPARSSSAGFTLSGGFAAILDAQHTGRPWLSGVLPRFATPRSRATLSLHGTELDLGTSPQVTVGGVAATVLSRARDRIQVGMGFQPVPGWQPVTVSTSSGTTTVVEGIGILPMLMTSPAPAPERPFSVVFLGSQNDLVVWAVSTATTPLLTIPGLLYGLGIHPAATIVLPSVKITAPSGELRLPIPPTPYPGPVYVQAAFSTSNPGYGPASFSNVLVF